MWPRKSKPQGDFTRRFGPNRPSSEYDASGAATFLANSYGDSDSERILPTFQSYSDQAYSGNSVVFSVILARIMLFSEAEFKFKAVQDGRLFGNQDLALLETPWPNGTTGELLARMEQDVSLAGNAYVRNVDGERLERLRPDRVVIASELLTDSAGRPYREVRGYGYDREGIGRPTEFYEAAEVAHWSPIPDPCASFRGMSWLTPIVREVNSDSGMTDYKIQYLEHASTPNMIVKFDKQIKPESITSMEDRLTARHGGVGNAFKTLVLDQGADIEVVGNSFEEMNFTTVQAAGEARIASAGGVPPIVVGLKAGLDSATYSNYSLAMRRFADLTMRPLWRSACGALAQIVTVPPAARLWFDTSGINALQAGEKERAEVFHEKAQAAQVLVLAGFEPESIKQAIGADDPSFLVHTGLVPTSVYQPGSSTPAPSSNGKTPVGALNG